MKKYQYPNDVEAAMDRFVEDNPGAGWRAIVRAFERAILQSMREGELRRTMISEKNAMKREVCDDCGVKEGQLHIPGCDMEPCPSCGGQLISCDCPSSRKSASRSSCIRSCAPSAERFGLRCSWCPRVATRVLRMAANLASGHLKKRGRHRGEFQMCRPGDIGPYCSTNVRIDRMETNASEAPITKRRLRLERQSLYGRATARQAPSTTVRSS